jgi:hypothetical protein
MNLNKKNKSHISWQRSKTDHGPFKRERKTQEARYSVVLSQEAKPKLIS